MVYCINYLTLVIVQNSVHLYASPVPIFSVPPKNFLGIMSYSYTSYAGYSITVRVCKYFNLAVVESLNEMLEVTSKPTQALIVLASMPKLAPKLVKNVFEPVLIIVMVLVTVFLQS